MDNLKNNNIKDNNLIGLQKIVMAVFFCISFGVHAQMELKSLFVDKQYDNSYKTSLAFFMTIDPDKELYNMDKEKMNFKEIKDDTGYDFLSNGNGVLLNDTYFSIYPDATKGNVLDLRLVIDGVPAKGAKTMELKGDVYLQYQGKGEHEKELTLQMPGESYQGVTNTEIGEVIISKAGSATIEEDVYDYFSINAPLPIKSFQLVAEDDSSELISKGIGVETDKQFVYKTQPAQVRIKFKFTDIEEVKMPLNMKFGIGF